MNYDFYNDPYSDEDLQYDEVHKRYVLTPKGVEHALNTVLVQNIDLSGDSDPSTSPEKILNRLSSHLYRWIYHRCGIKVRTEYLLNHYAPCREIIKECLVNEVAYALKNGTFWEYADNDKGELKNVSIDTYYLLTEELPNGYNLLYCGM